MSDLIIKTLKGKEIEPYISDLAKLRINILKVYPYLYDGDLDYEQQYLSTYIKCPETILVLVLNQNNVVVGASSAIPLEFETIEFQKPFLEKNIKIRDVFYLGESVLQPKYRGRGIYRHFFTARETAAKEYGCKLSAFAAVDRALDDPRKPKDYVPLDNIWRHFGYEKHPELRTWFEWKEIGESMQTPKPLIFWLKKL
jgi:GNAT superfamily N-acetyltransferase